MLTWRFIAQLNRSLVELVGLVIEKTEVAYLKSFPCIVVKKTFQATCGVALPHKLIDTDRTCFSSPKITSKFVLAKFHVCCTYHQSPGETFT